MSVPSLTPFNPNISTRVKLVVDIFQEERVVFSLPRVSFKDLHTKLKEFAFEVWACALIKIKIKKSVEERASIKADREATHRLILSRNFGLPLWAFHLH